MLGTIKGTIVVVCADNLGSAAVAGFKEGSRATHGCRHCMCTVDEMSTEVGQFDTDV